jgi:hypothetical protein
VRRACAATDSAGLGTLSSTRSTALLLEPLELLERLAALVPPPRRPLLAYHGLLAPRSRWRAAIVPTAAAEAARADAEARVPRRWPWARLLQRGFGLEVLVCGRCGGRRRILGAVTEPHAVRRLLAALGLAAESRRPLSSRPPDPPSALTAPAGAGVGVCQPSPSSGFRAHRAELPRALAGRSDAERQSRRGGEGRPAGPGAGEGPEMGGPR